MKSSIFTFYEIFSQYQNMTSRISLINGIQKSQNSIHETLENFHLAH